MEEIIKQMGFESQEEFNRLVSSVDLTNTSTMQKFLDWKENDGTKQGLIKIIN